MIRLIFILTCFIFLTKINGQEYHRFVERNKEFLILQTIYHSCPPLMETKKIGFVKFHRPVKNPEPILIWSKVVFTNDTIINGLEYLKILHINTDTALVRFFIRENENKEIFIINSSKELLKLYDFNLKLNDTIGNLIVQEIDTIENSEIKRLRFKFRQCCPSGDKSIWISGLGNMKEIVSHDYNIFCSCDDPGIVGEKVGGHYDIHLIRVKQNDKIIYLDAKYKDYNLSDIDNSLKNNMNIN